MPGCRDRDASQRATSDHAREPFSRRYVRSPCECVATRQSSPKDTRNDLYCHGWHDRLTHRHEARATAEAYGHQVSLIADVGVGVAGIHRILGKQTELLQADIVIVVAGMDGALPSVVGGLVEAPVIAVAEFEDCRTAARTHSVSIEQVRAAAEAAWKKEVT